LGKSLKITILLAILVSGVGHIYLGIIKRGIIILVVGIALWIIVPLFVPFPYSWVFTGAYWIWQLWMYTESTKRWTPDRHRLLILKNS